MKHVLILTALALSMSACGDESPTTPTALFTQSGIGNAVFDMPATVARVRIQAVPETSCQPFFVSIGGRQAIVDVILGLCAAAHGTSLDQTYATGGGGVVRITNANGVTWTFTEVR